MNNKVKVRNKKNGNIKEMGFVHAKALMQENKNFECAEPDKYKFINDDLIKQPKPKASKKPKEQGGSTTGGEVPK